MLQNFAWAPNSEKLLRFQTQKTIGTPPGPVEEDRKSSFRDLHVKL